MTVALLGLAFCLCAAAVGRAGYLLSASADALAHHHGWSRGWVGLALLATVTSLPELATGISAVTLIDAPNLGVGNALGACLFNLGYLVVVDLLQREQPMYRHASPSHLLSAAFGVVMLGFVAMTLLVAPHAPALLHLGLYSPVLLGLYLVALRNLLRQDRAARPALPTVPTPKASAVDIRPVWRRFLLAAAVVVLAGAALSPLADRLAGLLGLSRSFVGTVLLALVSSLPELAVTLAALRLRALDMAIGNLLGSNLFNIAILAIDDLAYTRGPLLRDVATVHAGTAVAAMVMTGLVMVGLILRPQGRVLRLLGWVSIGLLGIWLLNATLVGLLGT